MTHPLIFTAVEGTLVNSDASDEGAMAALIQTLKTLNIPVIPLTDRSQAEIAPLRTKLGLSDPFITENGSAIFIPQDHPFPTPLGELEGDYFILELGCPYVQARAGLRVIANELQYSLLGFGDMTIERLQKFTGLSAAAAQQAKARDFSEPFMTPKAIAPEHLIAAAAAVGFQVVLGDPFSQLIGPEASQPNAIQQLIQLYQSHFPASATLTTIGLGSSPHHLDLLETVDIPVILPGPDGPHPQLAERGWTIAPSPAPMGWVTSIQTICRQLLGKDVL